MTHSIPAVDSLNWGEPLQKHLAQLNSPQHGGFNRWLNSTVRPWTDGDTSKSSYQNYTGFNEQLGIFEYWDTSSNTWTPLNSTPTFDFWTDATRPSEPTTDQIGVNTQRNLFERWTGQVWEPLTNYFNTELMGEGLSVEKTNIDQRINFRDVAVFNNKLYTGEYTREFIDGTDRLRKWTVSSYDLDLNKLWTNTYWNDNMYAGVINKICVDSTGIYVVGYEYYDSSDLRLVRIRIERRSLTNGSIEWVQTIPWTVVTFGASGTAALDNSGLYITYGSALSFNIVKLNKTNGNTIWNINQTRESLGNGSAITPFTLAVDPSGVYIGGTYRREYTDSQGWLQKRNINDGSIIWNILQPFDGGQQVFVDLNLDSSGIYMSINGSPLRIEKRSLNNGTLIWSYDAPEVKNATGNVWLTQDASHIYGLYNVKNVFTKLLKTTGTPVKPNTQSIWPGISKLSNNNIYTIAPTLLIKYKLSSVLGFYGAPSIENGIDNISLQSSSLRVQGNMSASGNISVGSDVGIQGALVVNGNGTGAFIHSHIPSHNRALIGMEKNILFNITNRGGTVTVSGSGGWTNGTAPSFFSGYNNPVYTTNGIDPKNPLVITITGFGTSHIQAGGVFGFTTRYWPARRYKIEATEVYAGASNNIVLTDYSEDPLSPSAQYGSHNVQLPHGAYSSFKITIYEASGSPGPNGYPLLGISQIYFLHSEAGRAYSGLLPNHLWEGASGHVGIATAAPSERLHVVGNVLASGTITPGSDERWKTDIQPIKDPLASIVKLNGVNYKWNEDLTADRDSDIHIGLIAQQATHIPGAVKEDKEGFLHLDYMGLVGLLVEVNKELLTKIQALEEKVTNLENK